MRSKGVDVSNTRGNTDVHVGIIIAPKCRNLLFVLAADMCIARVGVRSIGVDVSKTSAILMSRKIAISMHQQLSFELGPSFQKRN